MINQRPSQFSHLLHRLRDFVSVEPNVTGVNRRDLSSPSGSDIQLEFDLGGRAPERVRKHRVPPPPRISGE